jgi:hypothetical protein
VLSRTNLACSPNTPALSPCVSEICGLFDSLCALFSSPVVCFQQLAASFCKTPGVGVPICYAGGCTGAQKYLFVSPLFATLTHSLSRKSFPCHSYANTRDGSAAVAPVSASTSPCLRRSPNFNRPLFSYSYESLFPQVLYFDNHPHCPGVWESVWQLGLTLGPYCPERRSAG